MARPGRAAPRPPAAPPSHEQCLVDHARQAYDLALKLLGDAAGAEDVVRAVLVRAARELGRFPDGAALHEWLSCVTAAEALVRRRGRPGQAPVVEALERLIGATSPPRPANGRSRGRTA